MSRFGGVNANVEDGFCSLKEMYGVLCSRNGFREDVGIIYELCGGLWE